MARWRGHTLSQIDPARPIPLSVDGNRQDLGTWKRKRDDEDIEAGFEADAKAVAITVDSGWLEDAMMTTDATPDAATNATPGTHTPASSVDSNIIQRIDPHSLSDDSRQGRKGLKGNQLDPEDSDYDNQSQLKDHRSSYTGTPSSLYIDPIDPVILPTDCSSNNRPDITSKQVQEAAKTGGNPPPEETIISEPILIGHGGGSQCRRIGENLLPNPDNHEDAHPARLQSQTEMEGSSLSQQSSQAEKEID
ncbi:hypothetical protein CC78DRAFT_586631 [Lojkania enalia]|uniref:Uncharacterized protein n=1 Tax=Lojkania enalia TaxID=147567 RepID=A0A9P4JX90_9PLEO|nr:hypothetical protein CC78DRAFT_586631 [Didymosphaeria enalia]